MRKFGSANYNLGLQAHKLSNRFRILSAEHFEFLDARLAAQLSLSPRAVRCEHSVSTVLWRL
jgi:hypothetical protein